MKAEAKISALTEAQLRIEELLRTYQTRVLEAWRGYERTMVIEIIRALDYIAFAFTLAPNRSDLVRKDAARHSMLAGAATALRPLLERLQDCGGPVPWGPTTPQLSALADDYLLGCGQLVELRRLTALERYGLAKTHFTHKDQLIIDVESEATETDALDAALWLSANLANNDTAMAEALVARKSAIAKRIDTLASVDMGWFIRYESDPGVRAYHHAIAASRAAHIAEGAALPEDVMLGAWPFSHWRSACVAASGRCANHIAFATRLRATQPVLNLRDLLTVFARKEDVASVWQAAGEDSFFTHAVMDAMTLNAQRAAEDERHFEIPLPFYVDIGRDYVLLPAFGSLLNPFSGTVRQLRSIYRKHWDGGVDGREPIFRRDLCQAFPAPRFLVPENGFELRGPDGRVLTDIDAVILDRKTGSLALVQLKWYDIYGRSLRERASRRTNLLEKGNEWVGKVSDWCAGRSAAAVAKALHLEGGRSDRRPEIFVVARHAARFSATGTYDRQAAWMCWAELVQTASQARKDDVLAETARKYRGGGKKRRSTDIITKNYSLPDLGVEVRIRH